MDESSPRTGFEQSVAEAVHRYLTHRDSEHTRPTWDPDQASGGKHPEDELCQAIDFLLRSLLGHEPSWDDYTTPDGFVGLRRIDSTGRSSLTFEGTMSLLGDRPYACAPVRAEIQANEDARGLESYTIWFGQRVDPLMEHPPSCSGRELRLPKATEDWRLVFRKGACEAEKPKSGERRWPRA